MVELNDKQKLALYKKSQSSGFSTGILEEVYVRGYELWNESFSGNPEQFGFDRVNSFIAGGYASELDSDLLEGKRGLWDNIHAKRERIKRGSGERMRKPGEKGAPTAAAIKQAQEEYVVENKHYLVNISGNNLTAHTSKPHFNSHEEALEYKKKFKHVPVIKTAKIVKGVSDKHGFITPVSEEYTGAEKVSKNKNDPSSRFDATTSLTDVYASDTPGQSTLKTIKRVVSEATYKGRKVALNKPFRTPGGPKKSAVYVDPDGDGNAKIVRFGDPNLSIKKNQPARKKSYCARSSGQGNLTKKDSANYWSRKMWDC